MQITNTSSKVVTNYHVTGNTAISTREHPELPNKKDKCWLQSSFLGLVQSANYLASRSNSSFL